MKNFEENTYRVDDWPLLSIVSSERKIQQKNQYRKYIYIVKYRLFKENI